MKKKKKGVEQMSAHPSAIQYIEVAIPLPVYKTYHYGAPITVTPDPLTGKRVLVPFGQRRVTGYVMGPAQVKDPRAIKSILDILDEKPLFPESMIPFFRWIADYYVHPLGEVIKDALPGGLNHKDFLSVTLTDTGKGALENSPLTPMENRILRRLDTGPCSLKRLYKDLATDFPVALIFNMERQGLIISKRELKADRTKPKMERYVSVLDPDLALEGRSIIKQKTLAVIGDEGEISVKALKEKIPSAPQVLNALADAGHLTIFKKRAFRDPFGEPIATDTAPVLTDEQNRAIEQVEASVGKGFGTYLLAGVTGSGKTEIYMQLAERTVSNGYSVLVLVPEIALISQIERRFRARFGECIALLHSGLSTGERYDQWARIVNKDVTIAIGARSAIFAPFDNIGLIIVDEEHDTSYKQEGRLKYNARDLAVVRARHHNCITLLGSATPSIQSYYNVSVKKYHEIQLTRRIEDRPLPIIRVVDLKLSRDTRGIGRFITPELRGAMDDVLKRGEQVLLFLNRRGFASYPVCTTCGEAIKCKNCDISLTLHRNANAYKCHYCGYTKSSVSRCSACGSSRISLLGLGTEKVESAVKALFPHANVARMDRDTTTRRGSILKILKDLKNGSIDVLIGTQMVAKGHDFPNITLVGIICADLSLSFPDFRAAERTFQLLAQVAGRAGRGTVPGRAILQTYTPNHFSILSAKNQDFKSFYREDIHFRKTLRYPPFSRMILLRISGKDKKRTAQHAQITGDLCQTMKGMDTSFSRYVEIMGPIEAAIPRVAGRYRWQVLLKGLRTKPLHHYVRKLLSENPSLSNNRYVKLTVDVDPFLMM